MPKSYWMVPFQEKNFQNKICISPFTSINVDLYGCVSLCPCGAWQPSHVGNIMESSLREILSNKQSIAIRASIINGTYKYCNANTCGVIMNNELLPASAVPEHIVNLLADATHFIMPNEITLALDTTCNLSCPSCRTKVRTVNEGMHDHYMSIGQRISNHLFDSQSDAYCTVMLSTTGEVFASPLLLEFINHIPAERYPNTWLSIQTNGLLAPSRWHRLGAMQNRVKQITVTVDAAHKTTYENLRRGGTWEDIMSSLSWLSLHCASNNIKLHCRMVVQYGNFTEMQQFYTMSEGLGADRIEYTRLTDWGTYGPKFDDHDVFDPNHALYHKAVKELEKVFNLPKSWISGGLPIL